MDAKEYYNNPENLARIQQHIYNKEVVFKNADGKIIRCIKSEHASILKKQIEHYNLVKEKYNIYNSIANYKNFPIFSWNINKRKLQYKDWTENEKYKNLISGYDFYMDFDNKGDINLTIEELKAVSGLLNKKNILHTIIHSGSGFHIKAKLEIKNQNPEYCERLANKLIDMFGLETIDKSIYRWQGLIKTPYSIDFKTMNICKPIIKEELKNYKK